MGEMLFDIGDWETTKADSPKAAFPIETGLKHEPGIYFGMPEAVYHAIPALSASGIKNLMVSSMDYWATSFLNPDYETAETSALSLGSAYGVRICEGKETFYRRFAYAFDKADHPEALETVEDLKTALTERGRTGLSKLKKDGLVALMREVDADVPVLDVLRADYLVINEGKEFLTAGNIKEIEIAARMIEFDPEARRCFRGGYPEVVVIWIDPATRVPMKARFDYLKIKAVIDLKSFSNPLGKSLNNAIASAMASRKYHIQAATYTEADRHAVRFAREGRVFGDVDPAWIEAFAAEEDRSFIFVWQQTGIAPVTRVKEFSRGLEMFKVAEAVIRDAKHKFAQCWQHFGPETPWLDLKDLEQFEDTEFPLWMLET